MTIATLARTIRHLTPQARTRLFEEIRPTVEDYLLAKVACDRFRKAGTKRVSWHALRS